MFLLKISNTNHKHGEKEVMRISLYTLLNILEYLYSIDREFILSKITSKYIFKFQHAEKTFEIARFPKP